MEVTRTAQMPPTRRDFYHRAIYGIWSLITATLGALSVVYLLTPSRRHRDRSWVEAGDVSELETNQPQEIIFQRTRTDGWKLVTEKAAAWVVKTPDQGVIAFTPSCTHLGCAYHWDEPNEKFLCPCHDSFFSINGEVLTGPSPRPLDRYEVRVEGTRLWLGRVVRGDQVEV